MIKQGIISILTDDSSAYPTATAKHNGKESKYTRLSPYGLDSNPPPECWVLLFNSQGQESVKFGMASDMLNRKKSLKSGECALHNTLTESFILLKENGDIEVDSKNDLIANIVGNLTATVTGNLEATATGAADITGSTITLTGSTITLDGDVVATSTIAATGDISSATVTSSGAISGTTIDGTTITGSVDVVGGGKTLSTHIHPGVTSGPSNTGPPV